MMAINFNETVEVKIPSNPSVSSKYRATSKFWAKTVEAVDPKAATGNDWSGEWLTRGSTIDLPIGTLFVDTDAIDGSYDVAIRVVFPNGRPWVIDTSRSKAWAQELRKVARKWLDMSPVERIVEASKGYLSETEAKKDLPDFAAARTLREEWIAELATPSIAIDPKSEAIAKIKALLVEHGITTADLG